MNCFSSLGLRQLAMDYRRGLSRQSSGLWRSLRDGDFDEEDVWDVLKESKDSTFQASNTKSIEPSVSVSRNFPSAARMIPRATTAGSNSSSNTSSHEIKLLQQQSAPVNIPDWSMISGRKSKKASKNVNSWIDDNHGGPDGSENDGGGGDSEEEEDDDDDGKFKSKLPPHELIAARLARTRISSFSVCEGVGRTLKGRDLSRVRNAVLTKTGFLESP
ncbi:hypothetical protein K2173_003172 [Erythroxylum novogranatense]|uniref:Senescence regulator n=1 Tax=Erythroxylum novogranatense TaxID=1862640 RepID=A0AAV8TBP1_9ROSI|nr:hypothetical protein K2173_003172 [Erythroxylum novogranatense]